MLKTCDKYKYEVEALKVVDQEIINNWEIEGYNNLDEALKNAKRYAEGYDLHLKEDGEQGQAVIRFLPEDEVALGAFDHLVVLFKIGVGEGHHPDLVEGGQAVLLQAFADHLGGLAHLEILILLHFGLQAGHFRLVGFPHALLPDLGGLLFLDDLPAQGHDLRFFFLHGHLHGQFLFRAGGFRTLPQAEDLLVLCGQLPLVLHSQLRQGVLPGGFHLAAEGGGTVRQLFLKLFIMHLGDDGGVAGLVHLEDFAAVGASDLVHGRSSRI